MPNIPVNKKLYNSVKAEAKRKFSAWPSAYASGWLVKEYKRRGGKYKITKKSRKARSKSRSKSRRKSVKKVRSKSRKRSKKRRSKSGLSRWFKEEWIDVCKLPKIVPCGRKSARKSSRKYPYCRPRYKVTSGTPKTARSLTRAEIKKRCSKKRRKPSKKVYK